MQVYLVGGAVRDRLLGLTVKERDWVVVGATRAQLLSDGYREVGREFPVFLHPLTHDEHALARLERKVAPGYRGFSVEFGPDVTLEEDLARRDLTINAIAEAPDGSLIDPYNGRADIQSRTLRHVSAAFVEDPVRVLRVARFAARFKTLGFRIAPETLALMRSMVEHGEVDALVAERVWQETDRALGEAGASEFFRVLRACGALVRIFPEIDALFGVPQPEKWHPEIDTGIHTLMVLDQAVRLTPDPAIRFAALVHDLGKAQTPRANWPAHRGHEERSVKLIETLSDRLRVPSAYRALAALVARFHGQIHRVFDLRPGTVVDVFDQSDAFRRPQRFLAMLLACEADARGRKSLEDAPYPQRAWLIEAYAAAAAIKPSAAEIAAHPGAEIAAYMHEQRVRRVAALPKPV